MTSTATKLMGLLRRVVFKRDGYRCVAPVLDPSAGPCYDQWGEPVRVFDRRTQEIALTVDHVWRMPSGAKGSRAPDDEQHLVTLCWGHHLGRGPNAGFIWALAHRNKELERQYLNDLYPPCVNGTHVFTVRQVCDICRLTALEMVYQEDAI